jgi:hypothetical protein
MTKFFISAYNTMDRTELEKKVMSKLVTPYTTTTFTHDVDNMPNGYSVSLPAGFEFALTEFAKLSTLTDVTQVLPIRYNEYVTNVPNPFKQPYEKLIWRLDYEGKHELIIPSNYTLMSYTIRYLRKPVDIDVNNGVDCEINTLYHAVIVDSAVAAILKTITEFMSKQPQRAPQQNNQQNTNTNEENGGD